MSMASSSVESPVEVGRGCIRWLLYISLLCLLGCAQVASDPKPDGSQAGKPADTKGSLSTSKDAEEQRKAQERERRIHNDWPNLIHYREANALAGLPAKGETRVVFFGDSITDAWIRIMPEFFQGKSYLDRGIGGQTTAQLLVRFRQDVVDLGPKVVVILAGTNDIAGNTGPCTPEMIEDNLKSMVEICRANGIRPVLASILPAADYPWKRNLEPGPKIVALNAWLEDYARKKALVFLDYYSAMNDGKLGLSASLSDDGVHPNRRGYAVMGPLAEKAIASALAADPAANRCGKADVRRY